MTIVNTSRHGNKYLKSVTLQNKKLYLTFLPTGHNRGKKSDYEKQ
jgi:hypothetical protein